MGRRVTARVPTTPTTRDELAEFRDEQGYRSYEEALQVLLAQYEDN